MDFLKTQFMKRLKGYLLWLLLITLILIFGCTKSEVDCRKCIILSKKYTIEKVYFKTDTLYQDYLCGRWLQVFKEDKKRWDRDTGFVVCGRDLFEKIIYVVK